MAEAQPPQVFPESRDTVLSMLRKLLSISTRSSYAGTYVSNITSAIATTFTIPAGAIKWTVIINSGTVTVGGVALGSGLSVSGGGIGLRGMASGIVVDATSGMAFIQYDTLPG